ncbi:cupin domain-containing protein [Natronococcus pandeyae]|uniref:Cupin domain-containing protein n=1 Tax=Natronococcus pandeyae TaxID=2055836 RepID=A0A8J8Q092_9EURY|nr:cupin domain-containing protein [Natronococcus pandeyae]TYL36118.1 cupin domain-containing protein [Natronococcus pandeyae]
MAAYEQVNYTDIEPIYGAMHALGESLGSEQVGVSMVRCEPGWRNKPHDHEANDHEEIYILIEGHATVLIDDDPIEIESGDAVWIPPESTRQIRNGETESAFVLISAPTSCCLSATCSPEDGERRTDGFVG